MWSNIIVDNIIVDTNNLIPKLHFLTLSMFSFIRISISMHPNCKSLNGQQFCATIYLYPYIYTSTAPGPLVNCAAQKPATHAWTHTLHCQYYTVCPVRAPFSFNKNPLNVEPRIKFRAQQFAPSYAYTDTACIVCANSIQYTVRWKYTYVYAYDFICFFDSARMPKRTLAHSKYIYEYTCLDKRARTIEWYCARNEYIWSGVTRSFDGRKTRKQFTQIRDLALN